VNDNHQDKRFTLVDIMVVLVILGAAVLLFQTQRQNVRKDSRRKAMTGNLRMLGSSAQQFMAEKGRTTAYYTDLVGTATDNYVRSVSPIAGEDYTKIVIYQTSTQISVSNTSVGTLTYNL